MDEVRGLLRKIVVPAELRWEIRDKLDQANLTERVLSLGSTASPAGSRGTTRRACGSESR
jgi:hypothetical protein